MKRGQVGFGWKLFS